MSLFSSKKFWMGIGGVAAIAVAHFTGFSEAELTKIVAVIISMILGQGLADFGKMAKK